MNIYKAKVSFILEEPVVEYVVIGAESYNEAVEKLTAYYGDEEIEALRVEQVSDCGLVAIEKESYKNMTWV